MSDFTKALASHVVIALHEQTAAIERMPYAMPGTEPGLSERDVQRIALAVADEMEARSRPSVLTVSPEDVRRYIGRKP